MASIGRTLLRFTGALLLGASATSIDNPGLLFAPTTAKPRPHDKRDAAQVVASSLDLKITPGKRSLGIRVEPVAGPTGMLVPDSRVDIWVVVNDPDQPKPVAKIVLENMRLLAIGVLRDRLPDGRSIDAVVATIEVTPAEGERLVRASKQGPIRLLTRGNEVAPRGALAR